MHALIFPLTRNNHTDPKTEIFLHETRTRKQQLKRKSTNFVVEEGKGESENLATQAHTGTLLEHPLG